MLVIDTFSFEIEEGRDASSSSDEEVVFEQ